jgi:uncharacterized protein (TIGR00661 family)
MKILYAIQGTGNGHITRALELIPAFKALPDTEVDILISGTEHDLRLPFEVKYKLKGLSFVFSKTGGIDLLKTFKSLNSRRLLRDISELPVEQYQLVVNDFEPISCRSAILHNVPCIGLSNQAATLHPLAPKPEVTDLTGKLILNHYAPCHAQIGFHFKRLTEEVFTPVIRKAVRNAEVGNKGHYTVYLPAYSDQKIIRALEMLPEYEWHIFSKHSKSPYKHKSMSIYPLQNEAFLNSMAQSAGVICNAGFGTTTEALFLGKKLLVVPMKGQLEQQCNAAMLKSMGVDVLKSLKPRHVFVLQNWVSNARPVSVHYPDNAAMVVQAVLKQYEEIRKGINPPQLPASTIDIELNEEEYA